MSFSGWLISGCIFLIIVFIALWIGWVIRNNDTPQDKTRYNAVTVWSSPEPGPNKDKNTCQLYQFPTAVVDIDDVPTAIPGNPTFNSLILNNLQGTPRYPTCLDPDQIMAQQVQHTCTGPQGVVDNSITTCYLIDGGTTGLGGTETFFTNTKCNKVTACAGVLSLISVNFQSPTNPDIFCIQNEGRDTNVTMRECNPSVNDQLFRVTRTDPGRNPDSLKPGRGQNGLIAQILDRDTNLCLTAGTVTTTTTYDPEYLKVSECTGSPQVISGTNVVMSECTGGAYPGYVWALLPSVSYCGVSGGCGGCTGCPKPDCARIPLTNNCTADVCDEGSCQGNERMILPPQIVYIGDINIDDIPIGPTGYEGLTGDNAIIKWLIDNNAKSLYYGGEGEGLILRDLGVDVSVCEQRPYISQYMSLPAYNTISTQAVCLAEGILGTVACTEL